MVLTAEFWANYSKKDIDKEFEIKIVRDDIIITIQKSKNRFQRLSYCNYNGSDFNGFFSDVNALIIRKINELKIENSLGLEWFVRGKDKPKDLIERLKEKGFKNITSYHKMGIDLEYFKMNQPIIDPQFVVKEVKFENMLTNSVLQLLKDCFPNNFIDIEHVRNKMVVSEQISKNEGNQMIHYLVFLDQKPVASAHLEIMNKIPSLAYLNGAETAKQYRGKGIYSTLLFKRIQKCKELGLKYLVIDADPSTSGPILRNFGFRTFDKAEIYRLKQNFLVNS